MCLPARMPSALGRVGPPSWCLGPLLRAGSRADRPEGSLQDEQAGAAPGVALPWLCDLRQCPLEIQCPSPANGQKGPHLAGLLGGLSSAACVECLLRRWMHNRCSQASSFISYKFTVQDTYVSWWGIGTICD